MLLICPHKVGIFLRYHGRCTAMSQCSRFLGSGKVEEEITTTTNTDMPIVSETHVHASCITQPTHTHAHAHSHTFQVIHLLYTSLMVAWNEAHWAHCSTQAQSIYSHFVHLFDSLSLFSLNNSHSTFSNHQSRLRSLG